jgi:hypothetical protein
MPSFTLEIGGFQIQTSKHSQVAVSQFFKDAQQIL